MNAVAPIMTMLLLAETAAGAEFPPPAMIPCAAHPVDKTTYWRWREIGGRQCWFRGHASMPKSRLHWEEHADDERPVPMADDRDRRTAPEPVAAAEPISVTTIRLRPGTVFEWMWRGLIIDMNARVWMDPTMMSQWHVF